MDTRKFLGLLPGMLDLLVLKAISLDRLHGYGVLRSIQQISGKVFDVKQGSLYPALYRLETQGLIASEWDESENRRHAKYYRLTATGRRSLKEETAAWERIAAAMAAVLHATPDGA
ncbi:MAG: PadR family transcriptional regulator [Acidobacteria bacterium]|nr:PadR family transcriptional regulator [Acidobacteriota bacterium]